MILAMSQPTVEELIQFSEETNNQQLYDKTRKFPTDKPNLRQVLVDSTSIPLLEVLLSEHALIESPTNLCEAVIKLLSNSQLSLYHLIQHVIKEKLKTEVKETLFRIDNVVSSLLTTLLSAHGTHLIKPSIKCVIKLLKDNKLAEFKNLLEDNDPEVIFKHVEKLSKIAAKFFKTFDSIQWPDEILYALSSLFMLVEELFPGMGTNAVGSVLFLRFLCPILINPVQYKFCSKKIFSQTNTGLQLFSKIIYLIYNNHEIEDKESYMCCLNIVIQKYSERLQKISKNIINKGLIVMKQSGETRKTITSLQYTDISLEIIEQYCAIHEIQIWQRLIKSNYFELASVFLKHCSTPGRSKIEELQTKDFNLSLSAPNVNLIQSICHFFRSPSCTGLDQEATIIIQIAVRQNLLETVITIASLHYKSDTTPAFPYYQEKIHLLIEKLAAFENTVENVSKFHFILQQILHREESGRTPHVANAVKILQYKFILICSGFDEQVADQLVPTCIYDDHSLLNFKIDNLKHFSIAIGTRKYLQREFSTNKLLIKEENFTSWKIPIERLSVSKICDWLVVLGLSNCVPIFQKNKISGAVLINHTEETLKDIGISQIGSRKTICRALLTTDKKCYTL